MEAALGSDTDSFIFPVIPTNQPAVASSLQEFGCEIVVLVDLESIIASMSWARVLTTLLMVLWWAMPEAVHVNIGLCLRLIHLSFVSVCLPLSAHISAISLKNSFLCDVNLTKRVKRPRSILTLSSSRISWRMSPSGDSLVVGLIPSPIHFWIAIRRHLESVSRISGL